jgi:hypothetical protein
VILLPEAERSLVLAANAGAYFYPFAHSERTIITTPERFFAAQIIQYPDWTALFRKIILINGIDPRWLTQPALLAAPNTYYFLWDPARCPHYSPGPNALALIRKVYHTYSFQPEDCEAFGLRFNSTMYAPPPEGFLAPDAPLIHDILFLGVPKDRLPLLRELHKSFRSAGLRAYFRIGLTPSDNLPQEQAEGWLVTREWMAYRDYLRQLNQSRALLDLYQEIQTGFSLRAMESLFFGKKLITNNRALRGEYGDAPSIYHPDNIFFLDEDNIAHLPAWLERPYVPLPEAVRDYYRFERWLERFTPPPAN